MFSERLPLLTDGEEGPPELGQPDAVDHGLAVVGGTDGALHGQVVRGLRLHVHPAQFEHLLLVGGLHRRQQTADFVRSDVVDGGLGDDTRIAKVTLGGLAEEAGYSVHSKGAVLLDSEHRGESFVDS